MLRLFILIALLVIVGACGSPGKDTSQMTQQEPAMLTDSTFYMPFKVKAYASDRMEFQNKAKNFFHQGVDEYRNKKNFFKAENFFRNAILQYPTAIAYYELGNVLKDKKEYEEALQAYRVAEQLGYDPVGSLFIQMSRTYVLMGKQDDEAADYLEYAIRAGFSNLDLIAAHPDFSEFKNSWYYKMALKAGVSGMTNPEEFYWYQFKKEFPEMTLPLTLDCHITQKEFEVLGYIAYDFDKYVPDMRNEKFERWVGVGHYFYAKVMETKDFVALVHIKRHEDFDYEEGEEIETIYSFYLTTFDSKGKIIDKKQIAGRETYEGTLKVATIQDRGIIEQSEYALKFEKDTEKEGFVNNPIISKDKIAEKKWGIDSSGKIRELTILSALNSL